MDDPGKTTEQLKRIIQLLTSLEEIGNTIIGQNNQIIKLLTPAPDTDVRSFKVSADKPTKQ